MDPKEVVLGFFKAAGQRDQAAVRKFLHPKVTWNDNCPPEAVGAGNFHSADEVIDYIWANVGMTRDLSITPEWMISEGDKVVVLINEKATIDPTDRFYEIHSIHVYTVRNDVIVSFINYFDPLPLLKATYDIEFRPAKGMDVKLLQVSRRPARAASGEGGARG